tara:strand:+ start:210 stop:662 length:453 start_codon:yes stop_codon:yes gene_type:complete
MSWLDITHFDGIIKIAGVQVRAILKSDIDRIWNENIGEAFEYWKYHFSFTNNKMKEDDDKGIDTSDKLRSGNQVKAEYQIPFISETGFRSDFFQYEKKPHDISKKDVKMMIEGRVKYHLGRNVEIIESYNKKPVEIVSKIPEKSWSSKDE